MAITKETFQQLIKLQEQDKVLDRLKAQLDKIPLDIRTIQNEVDSEKSRLQEAKAKSNHLQLSKKEKESQLQMKEEAVRKHGDELNKVKTNEAYKALLSEIEKAKADASDIETSILTIMVEMDQAAAEEKAAAGHIKEIEAKGQKEISALQSQASDLQAKYEQQKSLRDGLVGGIPESALKQYEHLRRRKPDGEALSRVKGNLCGSCRIILPPQSLVEMAKNRLVTCEACLRILYQDEAADPAKIS